MHCVNIDAHVILSIFLSNLNSNKIRNRKLLYLTSFFLFLKNLNSIEQLYIRAICLLVCHSFTSNQISSTFIFIEIKRMLSCPRFLEKNTCNFLPRETETIKLPEYKLHLFSLFLPLSLYISIRISFSRVSITSELTPHRHPGYRISASGKHRLNGPIRDW